MIVTATEFKTNLGKYLSIADSEEVLITRNGRRVAKLVGAKDDKSSSLRSLRGIMKDNETTRESIREERLAKYHESVD
jgi:prevent-host-death family protein